MTRTWLSRVAQLLKTSKKPTPPAGRRPRLGVEALEDRAVPASYTFDATANTLLITLGTNEALTVTADATNTTFALSGGSGTPVFTQNGGNPATSGSGTGTISIANADLTGSLTVHNTGAAASSNNDVTFAGGTVTSGTIAVTLTDTDGGSDRDDVTLSAGTLAGAATLSTQNGSIAVGSGTTINAGTGNIALTAGLGLTVNGALSNSGAGTVSLVVDPSATDVNTTVGGTVTVSSTAAITSGTTVQITGGSQDDTFDLTAQAGAALSVSGGTATTTTPGDALIVRGSVNTFTPNGTGAGAYTFTGAQSITFTGAETVVSAGATVSVSATNGAEGGTDGTITFTRTGNLSQPLTVNFLIGAGSTATFGSDYIFAAGANTTFSFNQATGLGTVTFAAGSSTATVTVDVTDDNVNENSETVLVNVGVVTGGQYVVGTATATVSIADNDPNNNGNGNGNGNGNNGTRTRKRPSFGGAFVLGDQMYLLDADGGIKAVVPVTRGTRVAFSDLTGDGAGDVVTFSPLGAFVLDGQTGNLLAVFGDFDGDRVPDILLYDPTTGAPQSVFLSRSGQSFPLS